MTPLDIEAIRADRRRLSRGVRRQPLSRPPAGARVILWLALAVLAGLVINKLMGFMSVEFVMRPVLLRARGAPTLLGWVAGGQHGCPER